MTTTLIEPAVIAGLLDAAAAHIEQHGWCRDDWHTPLDGTPPAESPACAFGAIKIAAGGDPDDLTIPADAEAAAVALCDHLALTVRHLGDPMEAYAEAIGGWNDADGRTADEVIGALRDAAKGCRAARYRESGTNCVTGEICGTPHDSGRAHPHEAAPSTTHLALRDQGPNSASRRGTGL